MTMHLERGLTTTSTKKRKTKVTKAQQEELERGWRERNVRLKAMRLPKETFEQYLEFVYGKSTQTKKKAITVSKAQKTFAAASIKNSSNSSVNEISASTDSHNMANISSPRDWITGPCASKPSPVYTGTKVVGIATMHKSNAVPIFSNEEAKEVSSMRR